jgi:hypothetical protein
VGGTHEAVPAARSCVHPIPVDPEFGVQVRLRKGDKIVRRDARGVIHVRRVTEPCVELADLGRLSTPRPSRRA